jgi:hypothetical protein
VLQMKIEACGFSEKPPVVALSHIKNNSFFSHERMLGTSDTNWKVGLTVPVLKLASVWQRSDAKQVRHACCDREWIVDLTGTGL